MTKWCFFLLFIVSFGCNKLLHAQKFDLSSSYQDVSSNNYFRINYQNDLFVFTDRNYTQGTSYEWVSPRLQKNPINFLFFKPNGADLKYGIALEHVGYTPNKIELTEIQFGDRPFASAVMIRSFMHATNKINRFSSSLSLGILGPWALGEEVQTTIHRAIGDRIPIGWKNQISNHPIINYEFAFEQQLFRRKDIFSLTVNPSAQIGTLFTNASVGLTSMVGKVNSLYSSSASKNEFQIYLFAQPKINLIGYDATLEGGIFGDKSVYKINDKELERITFQFNFGGVLQFKKWYFKYSRTWLTKEFAQGENSGWGGLYLGRTF